MGRANWRRIRGWQEWSIGIYVGTSPFHFHPPEHVNNPVLTREAVSDVPADFVADQTP